MKTYLIIAEYMNTDGGRTYRGLQSLKTSGFKPTTKNLAQMPAKKVWTDKISDLKKGHSALGVFGNTFLLPRGVQPDGWAKIYTIPFDDAQRMYRLAGNKDWHKQFPQLATYPSES